MRELQGIQLPDAREVHKIAFHENLRESAFQRRMSQTEFAAVMSYLGHLIAIDDLVQTAVPGGLITPQVTALISNGSAIVASLNAIRPTLRY
jgi:hypothetical protein